MNYNCIETAITNCKLCANSGSCILCGNDKYLHTDKITCENSCDASYN